MLYRPIIPRAVMKNLFFAGIFIFSVLCAKAQTVGVVLSGGGALGAAHIGVLRALEENNIPIDYIAGTSAGALVGGMYAAGWTLDEIQNYMSSEEFRMQSAGKIDPNYMYYFKRKQPDAGGFTIKFTVDSAIHTTIPTNIVSPFAMDFALMEHTAGPSVAANYNYDSLYVPFRCVAADVEHEKQVVFRKGSLADGIRSSTSYPFYFKPATVDGMVLFDGGLYNNFPSDVMYHDFMPDIIIGSNVAGHGSGKPDEDNLFSQIKAMLMSKTNYDAICTNMILIEPIVNTAIFDFSTVNQSVKIGYAAAIAKMDSITTQVTRRRTQAERDSLRAVFKAKQPGFTIDNIYVNGLNRNQSDYLIRSLSTRNQTTTLTKLRQDYFRLVSDDRFKKLYPRVKFNPECKAYDLFLDVRADNDFIAQFGGCFSSKPINTGFLSLEYRHIGKIGTSYYANAYFGKYYGSVHARARLDYPTLIPFYFEADFTLNSFDYFTSRTSFFEEVKPSYLILSERSFNFLLATPVRNKGKLAGEFSLSNTKNEYYQTTEFTLADKTDRTYFNNIAFDVLFERNTLNRKQYANEGAFFKAKAFYIFGEEETQPGSTSTFTETFKKTHSFFRARVTYERYFKVNKLIKLGIYADGVLSNQQPFNNYTATLLAALAFQPVPESQTLFLTRYRAYNYAAAGGRIIFSILKRLDLRLENYVFAPYRTFVQTPQQTTAYSKPFNKQYYMGSAALVYDLPFGPISLSLNYYDKEKKPLSLIFTLGYIIFNRRANQ